MKKVFAVFLGRFIPRYIVAASISYFLFKHEEETGEDITEMSAWTLIETISKDFFKDAIGGGE